MFNRTFIVYIYFPLLLLWTAGMFAWDTWSLFTTKWLMSATMAVGSFIAGSTSIGGGAVAFPVMTLIFNIDPAVARDFSLMIQSVGMMCATAAIIIMRIPIEKKVILWAGLGSIPGLLLGLEVIAPILDRPLVKTLFGSFVFSFGLMLWWINRNNNRSTVKVISHFSWPQAFGLFTAGILGGAISGILGSGVDIVVFSVLVLSFGVCEKVATPTSVILMGTTALIGMLWGGATDSLATAAWEYWWVCVPVVAFGAPFGAWCASHWSRIHMVWFLCALITLQYLGTLLIVPQTPALLLFNICIIAVSLLFFWQLHSTYKNRLEKAKSTINLLHPTTNSKEL